MKIFLVSLMISLTLCIHAQPYKSMFGKNSTTWVVQWTNLDFGSIDALVVQKDTIAFGYTWKKIVNPNNPNIYRGGIIREDTISGKVWYRGIDNNSDTTTWLAYDFSLKVGDSFDISNFWAPQYPDSLKIVDSVYYLNNRKHIRFRGPGYYFERMLFIEGVGCRMGPTYKQRNTIMTAPYLMCASQDGVQTFMNVHYGYCSPPAAVQDLPYPGQVHLYPNPCSNYINIENRSGSRITNVSVFDCNGRVIKNLNFIDRLNMADLPAGGYYLRLQFEKGIAVFKRVVKM